MPPKAKAKGAAAKARAKAAAAGKAKARAKAMAKGGGALPKLGALGPVGPPPVATRRWRQCGWDTNAYWMLRL